jgi:hypothetical protein
VISLEPSESQLENLILHWLNVIIRSRFSKLMWARKFASTGYHDEKKGWRRHRSPWIAKGHADIMISYRAHSVWLEVKTKKGRQNPNQLEFERMVKECGGFYYVVKSLNDAEVYFNQAKAEIDRRLSLSSDPT